MHFNCFLFVDPTRGHGIVGTMDPYVGNLFLAHMVDERQTFTNAKIFKKKQPSLLFQLLLYLLIFQINCL
jgi:hypothetical protein